MLPFYLQQLTPREHYFSEPYFVLDFETTNLEFGDSRNPKNRIVMAAYAREGHGAQLAERQERLPLPPRGILVAHNAKFELGWLIRLGYDVSNLLVWDTMIAEYVIAGNRRVPLDLGSVAERYGLPGKHPLIDALMSGGVCPSDHPVHLLEKRVLRDVETTRDIFLAQRARMDADGLLPVMFTRCITTPVLAFIEREGMALDPARVRVAYDRTRKELAEVTTELEAMAVGVNFRSGPQVAKFLYETLGFKELTDRRGNPLRTAGGKPRTDKEAMAALKAETPEQKKFVELRGRYAKLAHTMSSCLEFFKGVCDEYGNKFYGNFNQTRTKTHRLSSSGHRITFADGEVRGVQFQNLERVFKPLFTPREPEHVMVEVDGAGLEFRTAADLAHDEQARADILDPDHDVHTFTATIISNKPADAITKAMRTAAKKHTFKPLFSEGKSGSKNEVKYYQEFKARYSAITQMQEGWVAEVMRTGQLRIESGLICYWKLRMTPSGYIEGSNEVRNLPIQSFATADIIPVSLVFTFWRARYIVAARIVNTVHDSVVAEVHKDDVPRYKRIAVQGFLEDTPRYLKEVYGHDMFVPLGVGVTVGPHWGEGEEESISAEEGHNG